MLWSFYSPDAAAPAEELEQIRELADGRNVTHLAGGVHATAEPVQTLDAGWDMAAIGEGESTLLALVDAKGDPTGISRGGRWAGSAAAMPAASWRVRRRWLPRTAGTE